MEASKLTTCCFVRLCCSGELLLKDFSAMASFYGGRFRMGNVPGCEEDPVNVVALLEVACSGRMVTGKMLVRLCSVFGQPFYCSFFGEGGC